jgi:hypothetical protein
MQPPMNDGPSAPNVNEYIMISTLTECPFAPRVWAELALAKPSRLLCVISATRADTVGSATALGHLRGNQLVRTIHERMKSASTPRQMRIVEDRLDKSDLLRAS